MASVQVLRNFVDNVAELPVELNRSFRLMRELDEKAEALQAGAERAALEHLESAAAKQAQGEEAPAEKPAVRSHKKQKASAAENAARRSAAAAKKLRGKLEAELKQVQGLADQRVALARQLYDYVDACIRKMDAGMAQFEARIQQERGKLGLSNSGEGPALTVGGRARQSRRSTAGQLRHQDSWQGRGLVGAVAHTGPTPIVVDPDEPVYCYCRQVSHGEMVACDNSECPIEWFHYACVGISADDPPSGKWFCKECRAALGDPE